MINIKNKKRCCGCEACVQVCPKRCISFTEDEKGFYYPLVNKIVCIDCKLCEIVCPFINPTAPSFPAKLIAAINPNEYIRENSSSGGIFTMLAEATINNGGVVFGASFDENWEVKHKFTDSVDGLRAFRGAKYVQSRIGESFREVKTFLNKGLNVLFSGTGCQIAGLRLFLRKEYDTLSTIEIACHGVPSPAVWRTYLNNMTKGNVHKISSINFRDKRNGWKEYGVSITTDKDEIYERCSTNLYMQTFLKDLCLRPSCTNCPSKYGASGSDIIIGDFWGVESLRPEIYDNHGCSVVIVNTARGERLIGQLNINGIEITYDESYRYNPCIIQSSKDSRYSPIFWNNFKKDKATVFSKTLKILQQGKVRRMTSLLWNHFTKYNN